MDDVTATTTSIDRLAQAESAQRAAIRELAIVLRRARLDPADDGPGVVDLLLAAGFAEETEADTALLDDIAGDAE